MTIRNDEIRAALRDSKQIRREGLREAETEMLAAMDEGDGRSLADIMERARWGRHRHGKGLATVKRLVENGFARSEMNGRARLYFKNATDDHETHARLYNREVRKQ